MTRGLSTVLDIGIACLLVTASAMLLVANPGGSTALEDAAILGHSTQPPAADRVGRAVLSATITVETDGHTVDTSVTDHLVHAATDGELQPSARRRILNTIATVTPRFNISVTSRSADPDTPKRDHYSIGQQPPPGAAVDAAVFQFGVPSTLSPGVVITVRTWAP